MNLRLFFERRSDLSRDEKIDMVCHYVDNLEKQNNLMYNTLSDIAADKRAQYAHPEWGDIGDRARCVLGWVYRIGLTNPVFAKITYQDGKIYMEGPVQAVEEATTQKQNTQPVENEYWQKDPKKRANYDKFVQAHTAANLVDKAPEMFVGTKEDAKRLLNWQGDRAIVKTPIEEINIVEQNMEHLFDENERERRGFLLYAIKTMQNPNLIVESGKKRVYIKLFNTGTETKPHWQIVKAANDGTFYVTNYRPTRNQVEKEIKYGQVVYNLANVQNKGVPLSDNFIITQSDSDVNTQPSQNNIYYQGQISDNGQGVELTINSQEEMQGLSDEEFKNKMLETLKSFKGNKIFNQSLNGDIEIRTSSIKKYKSFFADKNKRLIVPYIPELLGKAKFREIEKSYMQGKEPNIKAYYKANIGITIDNNDYNVRLTVREDNQGNFFWDAQVKEGSQHATPATNPRDTAPISLIILQPDLDVNPLLQKGGTPNGAYHPADKAIEITKRANASTLPHEMAHYWLDNIFAYVKSGLASPDYIKSWNNAAAWMGVNPAQNFLRRSQHEKFARGYEKYLLTKMVPFDDEGVPIFKRYGQWLRQVYDRANSLGVRLTEDALRFFNEWTSGKLPAPMMPPLPMKDEAFIQKEEQVVAKVADAVLSRMDEQAQMANTALDTDQVRVEQTRSVPRITAGEERASRVYSREMEKISERLAEDTLAQHEIIYHKVSLAEQAERAAAFVRDNISMAKDIVDGKMPPPEGLLETPVLIAYEQEMLRQGEYNEYVRALETHSRLATIRGQEISSERLAEQSPTTVEWWLNRAWPT